MDFKHEEDLRWHPTGITGPGFPRRLGTGLFLFFKGSAVSIVGKKHWPLTLQHCVENLKLFQNFAWKTCQIWHWSVTLPQVPDYPERCTPGQLVTPCVWSMRLSGSHWRTWDLWVRQVLRDTREEADELSSFIYYQCKMRAGRCWKVAKL